MGRGFFIGQMTFHLVPTADFEAQNPEQDYVPEAFAREGFIHCTDDPDEMARVANRYYGENREPHLYLWIDKSRVRAPIRYEDPEKKYPQIYGPLNRDAIVKVTEARRDAVGNFLPPES